MTYKVQVDDIVREATSEEAARIDDERQAIEQAQRARVAAIEAAAAAKVSARAKLAALGLTDAELAALLGA